MIAPRVLTTRLLLWADGMAVTPDLILLRPERAGDTPLIAHETKHCQQMREVGTWTFWAKYMLVPAFRLEMELQAYRVQLALAPSRLDAIAQLLATRYLLDLTPQRARELLLQRSK